MLVFPYDSRQQRLAAYVRTAKTIHLYVNEVLLTAGTTPDAFVEPDAATGYAPIPLLRAAWRVEPVGPAVRAMAPAVRFVLPTGRAVVRGHYTLDAHGTLLFAERLVQLAPQLNGGDPVELPAPFEFLRADDALEIKLTIDSLDLQAAEA